MKNFSEFCKEYLFEQLDEQEGRSIYGANGYLRYWLFVEPLRGG